MTGWVRINLDNPSELRDRLGLSDSEVETIVRFRTEHGPIEDERQLESLLGGRSMPASILGRLDFSPSEPTAPEAPGA
jgi:hypothetical protein